MLFNLLTHPLFVASVISFFLGSFGYILVRLWLGPVIQYHRAKHAIQLELAPLGIADSERNKTSEVSKNLRRHADSLTSVYYDALPYWYRLLLEKREENPIEAATLLMKLSNTGNPEHTRQQREKIEALLKLSRKNLLVPDHNNPLNFTITIGVSIYPTHCIRSEMLVTKADAALRL